MYNREKFLAIKYPVPQKKLALSRSIVTLMAAAGCPVALEFRAVRMSQLCHGTIIVSAYKFEPVPGILVVVPDQQPGRARCDGSPSVLAFV